MGGGDGMKGIILLAAFCIVGLLVFMFSAFIVNAEIDDEEGDR